MRHPDPSVDGSGFEENAAGLPRRRFAFQEFERFAVDMKGDKSATFTLDKRAIHPAREHIVDNANVRTMS